MFLRDIEVYWTEECPWLNRNQVFYVERVYDEPVNEMIKRRYKEIRAIYKSQGLQFVYLPNLKDEMGQILMQYMGGSEYKSSPCQAYEGIIPQNVLNHVYCPCLIHYVPEKKTFYIAIFQLNFHEDIFWSFLHCNAGCYSLKPGAPFPGARPKRVSGPKSNGAPVPKGSHDPVESVSSRPRFHIEVNDKRQEVAEDAEPTLNTPAAPREDVRYSISDERGDDFDEYTKKAKRSGGIPIADYLKHIGSFGDLYTEEEEESETGRFMLRQPSEEELAVMADEENVKMIQQTAALLEKLERNGISKMLVLKLMKNAQQAKALLINAYCIAFDEFPVREVKLGPMERAFYILLLLHPEGIDYKRLGDYKKELLKIYRTLGARGNRDSQEDTIDNFCDPTKNMASISASRIKRAFLAKVSEELAEPYLISGPVGGKKAIPLDRELVHWNDETLCAALKIKPYKSNQGNGTDESPLQKLAKKIFGKG